MKYLREYNRYEEEQDFLRDIKEKVESHIADLIDRGFVVNASKNSSQLSIRIYPPFNKDYFWYDIKDYIIPTVKMLYIDYKVIHSYISLWQGVPFHIDEEVDLDNTETLYGDTGKIELERNELKSFTILIKYPSSYSFTLKKK